MRFPAEGGQSREGIPQATCCDPSFWGSDGGEGPSREKENQERGVLEVRRSTVQGDRWWSVLSCQV